METRSVTPMRAAKTGYVVMSIVFCVVGVPPVPDAEAPRVYGDLYLEQPIRQDGHPCGGYVVMSIVFCVVGVLFIALPARSAVMIGRVLGAAMQNGVPVRLLHLLQHTIQIRGNDVPADLHQMPLEHVPADGIVDVVDGPFVVHHELDNGVGPTMSAITSGASGSSGWVCRRNRQTPPGCLVFGQYDPRV